MSARTRSAAGRVVALTFGLALVMAAYPGQGAAAVGDILTTVTVGAAADCVDQVGTSVALVQGSKAGLEDKPVLLVTSCFAPGGSKSAKEKRASLYFLDPANGAVMKTIQTRQGTSVFAPDDGWAKLALAPDKSVLLGCSNLGSLFTIDYSVFTANVVDGTLTSVPRPAAVTSCGGLAWDPSDDTIYEATSNLIYHFTLGGAPVLPSTPLAPGFPGPTGCVISGLAVVGGVLMVSCEAGGTVHRLDKTTGLALDPATMSSSASPLSDLECDPVTFGATNRDVMWSKNPAADQVRAFQVPPGTCALPPTATAFAPAACPPLPQYFDNGDPATGNPKDTDGDGLWDCWEENGIDFDGDQAIDLVLCASVDTDADGEADTLECADPLVKDVFVEIDFMEDALDPSTSRRPDAQALFNVRQAFLDAPVENPQPGGAGPTGVRLHFLVNEAVPLSQALAFEPCTSPAPSPPQPGVADFDVLKSQWFGADAAGRANLQAMHARHFGLRYMLFAHSLLGTASSGCAEVVGNDAAIALGSFEPVTTDQEAGTVMHELGHTLGLRHGGGDGVNCKPNYRSVMNYSFQFPDFVSPPNWPLDFSRDGLDALNEADVSEALGIGALSEFPLLEGAKTVYSAPTKLTPQIVTLGTVPGTAIDWNGDGDRTDLHAVADINKITRAGCTGEGTVLKGYNDWANLVYNSRMSVDFAAGAEVREKTAAEERASWEEGDLDGDGVPDAFNCGSPTRECAIDVKPGENPQVLSKKNEPNVKVAILSSAQFNAPDQVDRSSLRLNGIRVKLNQQDPPQGTCSVSDINRDKRKDLVCQFFSDGLVLGTNFVVLEGRRVDGTTFRARDLVTVVK